MEQFSFVVNIVYISITLLFSFSRPTITACLYIVFQASYFGVIPNEILLSGTDVGSFFINILLLLPLFIVKKSKKTFDKHTRLAIMFFSVFTLYGIILPFLQSGQSLFQGVKAAKSFLPYFFFMYLMAFRCRIKYNTIFRLILLCSIYFATLYLINRVGMSIIPKAYEKDDFLQCHYDSFFSLAIIYLFYLKHCYKQVRFMFLIYLLLCLGIYIGGYFSLFATTLALSPFLLMNSGNKTSSKVGRAIIAVLCLFLISYLMVRDQEWFVTIVGNQQEALLSREVYNEFRWDFIFQHLLFGGGFLHQTSNVVESINSSTSAYQEGLTFIDAGFVDLFVRFGIIGTFIFLLYPIVLMVQSFKRPTLLPFSLLIFQFICVNYTWSVFSFPHGITVLSIVYSFIIKNIYDKS